MIQRSGSFRIRFQRWLTVAFLPVLVFSVGVFYAGVRLNAQSQNSITARSRTPPGPSLPGRR